MNTDRTEIREGRTVSAGINMSLVFFVLFMSILPVSIILPSTFMFLKYVLTFLVALMLAWWATPLARNAALRYNIVDIPDGKLKDHTQPTPYLGGIVVYIAFLLTLAITFGFTEKILGITLAGSILVIIGLFDDMQAVRFRFKPKRWLTNHQQAVESSFACRFL